jgi:hypothetical protein
MAADTTLSMEVSSAASLQYHFWHCCAKEKMARIRRVKYWEIIADNLSKAGWSWGCVSAIDPNGQTIWIADAHWGAGKRFVVHADEKLAAFLELDNQCRRRRERKSPSPNWSCNEILCALPSL